MILQQCDVKMQSICVTKDGGVAGTVMLACPGTRGLPFPTLFSCSIYSADVPGQLHHLKKCHFTCQTVWMFFGNALFVEGLSVGFRQRKSHQVRCVSQLLHGRSTQSQDHTRGLIPLLSASLHYPGYTKLKWLCIKMPLQVLSELYGRILCNLSQRSSPKYVYQHK